MARYNVEIEVITYHQYVIDAPDLHEAEELALSSYEAQRGLWVTGDGPEVVSYFHCGESSPAVVRVWEAI
jgi:hypothetical protein